MTARRIAHLDMDAFYASVELLRRPELREQPVAIGGRGDPTRRGVVTTANYVARTYGIRSAMPMRTAYELCPQCVFLPVDFDEYRRVSRLFKAAIREVAPVVQDNGIDEAYIDLTELPGDSAALARAIKDSVLRATGLTCSIAVAPNKLLAKIGSELDKPDGLTVLTEADLETRIWPLAVRRLNGVGPKSEAKLAQLGIRTLGELARRPLADLVERFGASYGRWLHESAHGRDERPVVTFSEPKSRSRETTFERDTRDRGEVAGTLAELCAQVAEDLRSRGYAGRTIGVKLRYADFRTVTRDVTLAAATSDAGAIREAAFEALGRIPLERAVRLIGVRVGNLCRAGAGPGVGNSPAAGVSLSLF
ncbi:MAG TPA: DNA polymerase IV [Burkholderiales bacterium]|nr:DNA polymerase IV [Burkholderiales bacterium]